MAVITVSSMATPAYSAESTYALDLGGPGKDYVWGVAGTDNGFIAAGYTDSYGKNSAFVIRVTNEGDVVWEEIIGSNTSDELIYDIGKVGDYYVLAGWNKTGAYNSQPIVFQVDGNGNLLSSKRVEYSGGISGWFFRVIPVTNETYILVGYDRYYDIVALKLGINGSIVWSRSYHRSGDYVYMYGSALDNVSKTLYIAANEAHGGKTALIALNSTDGSIIWSKEITITGSGNYVSMGVTVEENHDILVYGYNKTTGNIDGFICKLTPQGDPLWGAVFGASPQDMPMDAIVYNNTILLAGYTEMGGIPGNNSFIASINQDGGLLWFNVYGGEGNDWFYRIRTSNGYLTGIGGTNSYTGNDDVFIVNMESNGNVTDCNIWRPISTAAVHYRSVSITAATVAFTANTLTASIIDYPSNVYRVHMPIIHICPQAAESVGGELIPLNTVAPYAGEAIVFLGVAAVSYMLIIMRKRST